MSLSSPPVAQRTLERTFRIEVRPEADGHAGLSAELAQLGFSVSTVRRSGLLFVAGDLDDESTDVLVQTLLAEPIGSTVLVDSTVPPDPSTVVVEVARRAGVTDPAAAELVRAARAAGLAVERAASGTRFELVGLTGRDGRPATDDDIERLCRTIFANPVIEQWTRGPVTPGFVVDGALVTPGAVERVAITDLDDEGLAALDRSRGLALDPIEQVVVRDWFTAQHREPTDVELETLAQTWSEHCSHKTFRVQINGDDGRTIAPLLRQLRDATDAIAASWVVSAFVGNAGIVELTPGERIAVKVETHNHPSAVEPFGGANTGVGGVIRDVLAAPAQPIALTDILCFGPIATDPASLPEGVLPPGRIAAGVIAGVADYGNKMGVPTIAGAILHDPGYTANPLVFCGCIGRVHAGADALDGPHAGDRVIVMGGATGRDGIRGATFSSMTMDATTGSVAGASVQIGDPIVEKLVTDALAELFDRVDPPCSALTDCGAGGLASAVGELADGVGADIDLRHVPRKYAGLEAWEVWLSEAQERMVLAVRPDRIGEVADVCARHGVAWADLGAFGGDGRLVVRDHGTIVLDLPTSFLHGGRPTRQMTAERFVVSQPASPGWRVGDPHRLLLQLLAHPTIASKADVVHRYDHEVLGATVIRPLTGAERDAPSDGTVIAAPTSVAGLALGIGVNPWFGVHDPLRMAHAVVDEAVRNVVASGGDPDRVALLDNFSWGDPRRPATLGALVDAVRGCCEAAVAHGAPFVSGKDSLNNEYLGADGQRHAIPPTLVITAVAAVPDADAAVTTDLKRADDVLLLIGSTRDELRGSHVDLVLGIDGGGDVPGFDPAAPQNYRHLHQAIRAGLVRSAHDCSEGGLAVALAEMAIGGRLGLSVMIPGVPGGDPLAALFSESNGRLVIEAEAQHVDRIVELLPAAVTVLGRVVADPVVTMTVGAQTIVFTVEQLRAAWNGRP